MRPVMKSAVTLCAALTLVIGLTRAAGHGLDSAEMAFASYSNADLNYDIFLLDTGRNIAQNLTSTPATRDYDPAWSPDGTQLAFASTDRFNGDIYLINADGSNLRRLTHDLALDFDPEWSPDGRQIVFVSNRGSGDLNLFVMDVSGDNVRQITDDWNTDRSPSLSPDGRRIAFFTNRDGGSIYLTDIDGNNERPLVRGGYDQPAWSPDGTQIAFLSQTAQVFVMDLTSDRMYQLTLDGQQEAVGWLPNGTQLLFLSYRNNRNEIYVVSTDGSGEQLLMPTGRLVGSFPIWRPA